VCFGSPFYAGLGFTDDRGSRVPRPTPASPLQVFAAYHLRYARYFDAYSRQETTFEQVSEQLAWLRDRFLEQPRAVCFKITRWKRSSVNRMLDGPDGPPLHASAIEPAIDLAKRNRGRVVAWASRDNERLKFACRDARVPLVQVEDGFVRSAGLGASFVLPLSLVFDAAGIYYDPRTPSDLETLLQDGEFSAELVERARRLRESLIGAGTTKYNVGPNAETRIESGGKPIVLVPGQVEDDASIRLGSPRLRSNLELLGAVRERHPGAFILYKPHPDVEAGFRRGHIPRQRAAELADLIVPKGSILHLIGACDRLETITSLAGFEALLRGKPVTTHGQPFFAGWGMTEDLCPVPRRTRRRSLDELVAAALILYPRYIDPVTGLACSPELLVERLAAAGGRQNTAVERLVRLAQISAARALYYGRSVKHLARRDA
jgi:capsular polysaccharide export protein